MVKKEETLKGLEGKRILIWGYGREGKSTESFLKTHVNASISVFEGKPEELDDAGYDMIIKSPGIPYETDDDRFTSQTEIFLECFRDITVGITGTKGKSTTSAMCAQLFKELPGKKVILVGNIGLPALDHFDEIDDDTYVVYEMSCHQLRSLRTSPHIAVFLNLFEEHLDYYVTMEKYFAAKANIAKNQLEGDICICGENVPYIESKAKKVVIAPPAADGGGDEGTDKTVEGIYGKFKEYSLGILGEHNVLNANFAAYIAGEIFGLGDDAISKALAEFKGLPHRLYCLGEYDGRIFYDDSISTIPNATIEALAAVKNAQCVIVGGMDRGISYELLTEYIQNNPQYIYILCYASGKRIYESVSELENTHYVEDLRRAVELAKKLTLPGRACILSPAAASYGYFKNFEERGDRFAEYVRECPIHSQFIKNQDLE